MKYPDLSSRRARLAIRFFTYGVMTVTTVALSAILLFLALGYRFDKKNLTFSQGALIQLRSRPEGANILVDNAKLGFNTPGKIIVSAGGHQVSMSLNGYRPWSKTVTVQPGQLLWLNYIRLVPDSITTRVIKQFPELNAARFSPDRRWLALQPSAAQPLLLLADLRNEQKPAFSDWAFTLPPLPPGTAQSIEIVEWDLGGRFLLIKRTVGQAQSFFRLDREKPAEALAVNPVLPGAPAVSAVHFAGTNGDVIYVLTAAGELRRLSLSAGGGGDLLASGVTQFNVYRGDMLWYIADRQNVRQVGVIKNSRDSVPITYPAGTPLRVALSSYFGHDYLAVADANRVSLIRDPAETAGVASSDFASFKTDQSSVDWLYFSANGRMLVAQQQANLTVYDLETNQIFRRSFPLGAQEPARKLGWLDDYYFWLDFGGNLRIVEFDGSNERFISSVHSGFEASFSENGQVLFSVGQNTLTKAFELQASNMIAQ
ncbi:MAG: PEGA domain-containing protein [Candidatus Chaera renei]|uniref:PEGA domain-containing protein n=1 Tax=Candidatus Chaera renei TaxID=2506947 RepID=A0A4Q0AIN8_9BACT|nr:MAG: PEGA domain-containing protein [Candidatus Chaera renei]